MVGFNIDKATILVSLNKTGHASPPVNSDLILPTLLIRGEF